MSDSTLTWVAVAAMLGLAWKLYADAKPAAGTARTTAPAGAELIIKADGWEYFSDGTVIGPDGQYYYQGQLVFTPLGAA